MKFPHKANNPRIVIGYDNQIKLMVDMTNNQKWTKKDFKILEKLKLKYLEKKLGYKIKKLSGVMSHKKYEKHLEEDTTFYKKEKKKS